MITDKFSMEVVEVKPQLFLEHTKGMSGYRVYLGENPIKTLCNVSKIYPDMYLLEKYFDVHILEPWGERYLMPNVEEKGASDNE